MDLVFVLLTGIEPAPLPWEGNDSTILSSRAIVPMVRFKLTVFLMYRFYRPASLHHRNRIGNCDPGKARTCDSLIKSEVLWPIELRSHFLIQHVKEHFGGAGRNRTYIVGFSVRCLDQLGDTHCLQWSNGFHGIQTLGWSFEAQSWCRGIAIFTSIERCKRQHIQRR